MVGLISLVLELITLFCSTDSDEVTKEQEGQISIQRPDLLAAIQDESQLLLSKTVGMPARQVPPAHLMLSRFLVVA